MADDYGSNNHHDGDNDTLNEEEGDQLFFFLQITAFLSLYFETCFVECTQGGYFRTSLIHFYMVKHKPLILLCFYFFAHWRIVFLERLYVYRQRFISNTGQEKSLYKERNVDSTKPLAAELKSFLFFSRILIKIKSTPWGGIRPPNALWEDVVPLAFF